MASPFLQAIGILHTILIFYRYSKIRIVFYSDFNERLLIICRAPARVNLGELK